MTIGMQTGFANQASKHCLRIWPRPLASLRKQYLQPADGIKEVWYSIVEFNVPLDTL